MRDADLYEIHTLQPDHRVDLWQLVSLIRGIGFPCTLYAEDRIIDWAESTPSIPHVRITRYLKSSIPPYVFDAILSDFLVDGNARGMVSPGRYDVLKAKYANVVRKES